MRKAGSPFELCRMQIGEFRHHRASKSKDRAKSIMARKLPVCTWTWKLELPLWRTIRKGGINPEHKWKPVRHLFYKFETDPSLSNLSSSPGPLAAGRKQYLNVNLLLVVSVQRIKIFRSLSTWSTSFWLTKYGLELFFEAEGFINFSLVLGGRNQNIIQVLQWQMIGDVQLLVAYTARKKDLLKIATSDGFYECFLGHSQRGQC